MRDQPTTGEAEVGPTVREAMLPPKLRDWRAKLGAKAKQEKRFRFYSLYGLVSHPETLKAAWAQVRANRGGAGVDRVTIEQIEREGEETFLGELVRELKENFVIMARYAGPDLQKFVDEKIEGWLGLKINREKTRVIDLRQEGQTLDFLGFSFRYDRDLHGRGTRYWNMYPSKASLARERDKVRGILNKKQSHTPLPDLIGRLNRHLTGWANYYRAGYSRCAFRDINRFVRERLTKHLRRRSQRGWRLAKGSSVYSHLERMGLIYL